jgi:hypothetical protein
MVLAWIAVISELLAESDRGQPLAELAEALVERCGENYLLCYYSREQLMSEEARRT